MNALLLAAALLAATPEATIEKFLTEWRAGKAKEMRALMSDGSQRLFTEAQIAAYVAAHKRALGELREWETPKAAKEEEYATTLTFATLNIPATFGATDGRVDWFTLEVPAKAGLRLDEDEVLPVARDMLAFAKTEGIGTLTERVSDEYLESVDQNREEIAANLNRVGDVLGPLSSFELDRPTELRDDCREVTGKGRFQYGQAALRMHLCWIGGLWHLRHTAITPDVTPEMVERLFLRLFHGSPKVSCPRVEFPIGGEIVCRIELAGEPPQNATIRRTGDSSWQIVGLEPVKE